MFTSAGMKRLTVKEVIDMAEPKFAKDDPEAFDVCLLMEEEETGESDWWHGECSGNFGKGVVSHMTQLQLTMQTLVKLGLPEGDFTRVGELLGAQTTGEVVESEHKGKTYYNLRSIGVGGNKPREMSADEKAERLKAMFGKDAKVATDTKPAAKGKTAPAKEEAGDADSPW